MANTTDQPASSGLPAAWTQTYYPREGNGVGFDRVVFFSDAVFAIALTLMAVEIGIPEITDSNSVPELREALIEKLPLMGAFLVAFIWVAIYWRANHRFTNTLAGMNGRYVLSVLVYLGLVAFLPFPAGLLGEYWENPLAVAVFSVYAACLSLMEVVMQLVASRDNLYIEPLSPSAKRWVILGSLSPIPGFLIAVPLAFISTPLAIASYFVVAVILGFFINKFLPANGRTGGNSKP